ncbi:uncharacterized protein LOC119604117 isoform X1 [Lucilia sericata]|uniref:uncharacterized protein LOC119604117 isoform X1 n=1 Tax=Lucilia sericata TaxID=13632 RepID=UPI0018A83F86|nr:uncharacterized protein LOC119604117 isoform X1 [Lucilia sericata]
MHKNTLWFIFAILCIYFSLVLCEENTTTSIQELESKDSHDLVKRSDITDLLEEEQGRTRRRHRHHLYAHWGFYGLAIAYLIKIKVVVVAFFVGSAIYLGLRYLWPHKCGVGSIYKEGSIVLDHPPYISRSFAHHDHIPYSLDHDHDHYHDHHHIGSSSSFSSSGPTSFEPYSAYSSNAFSAESDGPPEGFPSDGPLEGFPADGPLEGFPSDGPTFRSKRSVEKKSDVKTEVKETLKSLARQMVISEEQIGEFMFGFLGLDTSACRRRFICEMEFKSRGNPLTSMGFRIIGRSFFAKYTNDQNPNGKANNFGECAVVNSECVFIENNEEFEPEPEPVKEQDHNEEDHTETAEEQLETNNSENEVTTEDNSLESNDIIEKENEKNLKAELRRNSYRRRLRGDRYLKLL